MSPPNILVQIKNLLIQNKHRKLCVLRGCLDWQTSILLDSERCSTFEQFLAGDVIVYSENNQISGNICSKTFRQHLGKEYSTIVFVGDSIHPDMFSALAGTLKAGGIFYWLISKAFVSDNYSKRFYHFIEEHHGAVVINEDELSNFEVTENKITQISDKTFLYSALNAEQENAVAGMLRVARGHRNRPMVLTADRGRGKSAALALAVAELFKDDDKKHQVLITASNKLSVHGVFELLDSKLDESGWQSNQLSFKKHSLQFLPIDEILRNRPECTLVLIDEAASIPLYLLEQLLDLYSRTVFASTLHGYEGAGRGFALRFENILVQQKQQPVRETLTKPIRWRENDPLEQFVFDACLLNAELPVFDDQYFSLSQLDCELIEKQKLVTDEKLLKQIFSLLVTAHYQTSPDDLQLLLNNDSVSVLALSHQGTFLAVALVIQEGGVSEAEKTGILAGRRRLKDQFVPQLLSAHAGVREAFDYSYWRIMRIAVHPAMQSKGIGSEFLSRISVKASEFGIDVLATSFGINKALLKFWCHNGFVISRIGLSKDKSSGEHSSVLIKPISKSPIRMLNNIQREFLSYFSYLLLEEFNDFSPQLVSDILVSLTVDDIELNEYDETNLRDFADGTRQFDYCAHSVKKFVLSSLVKLNEPVSNEMIALCLMRWSKAKVIEHFCLTGRKALNSHLVEQVQDLVATHFQ